MKTIWKYPLPLEDEIRVKMPRGSRLLTLQWQKSVGPALWALVDSTEKLQEEYVLAMLGTGHDSSDVNTSNYLGTFQVSDLPLVFHVFVISRTDVDGEG